MTEQISKCWITHTNTERKYINNTTNNTSQLVIGQFVLPNTNAKKKTKMKILVPYVRCPILWMLWSWFNTCWKFYWLYNLNQFSKKDERKRNQQKNKYKKAGYVCVCILDHAIPNVAYVCRNMKRLSTR